MGVGVGVGVGAPKKSTLTGRVWKKQIFHSLGAKCGVGSESKCMDQKLFDLIGLYFFGSQPRSVLRQRRDAMRKRGGALVAVGRGVYVAIPPGLKRHQVLHAVYFARVVAFVRSIPHQVVVCGLTAAFIRGYAIDSEVPSEITVYQYRGSRAHTWVRPRSSRQGAMSFQYGNTTITVKDTRVRRFINPPDEDTSRYRGLTLTSAFVTFIDTLRLGGTLDAFTAANFQMRRACRMESYRTTRNESFVKEQSTRFWERVAMDVPRLRKRWGMRGATVLSEYVDPRVESAMESRSVWLLHLIGVDNFELQKRVRSGNKVYFVDVWFPHERVAIEIDGKIKYNSTDYIKRDRDRERALWNQNIKVVHLTYEDVRNTQTLLDALMRQAPELVKRKPLAA